MRQRVLSVTLALCLLLSSQSMASAKQQVSLPQRELFSCQEEVPLPLEDALPQEDGSLPVEDAIPQEKDTYSQESISAPLQEDSLPQENGSMSLEKATLSQKIPLPREEAPPEESPSLQAAAADGAIPTPAEVYAAMIALKEQDAYKEGTTWTNNEPYSGSGYRWNGGLIGGVHISAVGCVAFAFILSDAAFGNLPNRMYGPGEFDFDDIKAGDILRVNNDIHTVIVLEVNNAGVVVAEGNISTGDHKGKVHWGRAISKEDVMSSTSHYITRYPQGYIPPDDPSANDSVASGSLDGGLAWNLTKAGTLTISGSGAMPDFSSAEEQPWYDNSSQIRTVAIENGVTGIGACAFWKCGVLSVEIPSSVTAIGNHAFRESSIISVSIPSGVKTIGNDAFNSCTNLSSVTVSEGVEAIGERAFQSCASLASIVLPSSVGEVGAAAFWQCQALTEAAFAPGSKQVKLGDNLFTQCYYLRKVTLPQSIDRIGDGMFQNCLMLAGVEIPQGAESIGESAFASCSVFTTVIIPDSVTIIGRSAFASCPLKDIYFTGSVTQWNSISKIADTAATVAKATIHYEYSPEPTATPVPTTEPQPSATPVPTAEPQPSATPVPTATPLPTAAPVPTQAPEQTAAPPAPTSTPKPIVMPEQTPAPGQTAAPMPTQAPIAPTPTPPSMIPSISGEPGKEGWTAIKDEITHASAGGKISVSMNGASIVPGGVIDSVKGQDVTISFDMGSGIIWTVDGLSVTADHTNDIDFSVQLGTSHIPQDIVDQAAGNHPTMQLSLAHSGDFGCSAVLAINVGSAHAGLNANLYYYNEGAVRLEYVAGHQINEDGITELTFTHASDYIIIVKSKATGGSSGGTPPEDRGESADDGSSTKETELLSPKAGEDDAMIGESSAAGLRQEEDSLKFMWLLLIGAATAAGSYLIYKKESSKRTR